MPRQTRGTIPVYSAAGHENIVRRVSHTEAVNMIQLGHALMMHKFGRKEILGLRLASLERLKRDSAAAITHSEMQANVGITGGLHCDPGPANRNSVHAAQSKIAAWDEDLNSGNAPLNPEYRGAVTIIAGRGATHVQAGWAPA